MSRLLVLGTCLFGLTLLTPGSARADLLVWNLLADCPAGKQEVKLTMTYSVASYWSTSPQKAAETLYGCGGICDKPGVIATKIDWKAKGTRCYCMKSGIEVASESECPADDYAKCSETVEATLPYACDTLGHTKICSSDTCEAKDDMMYGPDGVCATLKPSPSADQCFVPVAQAELVKLDPPTGQVAPAELDDLGGCSVGTANASLMALLLVVAGLSLLLSRRRRR